MKNIESRKKTIYLILATVLFPAFIFFLYYSWLAINFLFRTAPITFLASLIILGFEGILLLLSRKPLSYNQLSKMAHKKSQKYLQNKYFFSNEYKNDDYLYVSQNNIAGQWYSCNIPVNRFPITVSSWLKGKKYEWAIIGIESKGIVKYFWANQGSSNKTVELSCSLEEVIEKCRETDCYTLIHLHNHPNPNPQLYTTLLASNQDIISARSCSNFVSDYGMNWIDFVCSRGQFIKFYHHISPKCQIPGLSTSDYVDEVGISFWKDYLMRRKYYKETTLYRLCKYTFISIFCSAILIHGMVSFIHRIERVNVVRNDNSITTENISEITPTEEIGTKPSSFVELTINNVYCDSEFKSKSGKDYSAHCLIDGDYTTCWQDGSSGNGEGEKLHFQFDKSKVYEIGIVNGNRSYDGAYSLNNRLSDITISFYLNGKMVCEATDKLADSYMLEIDRVHLKEPILCDLVIIRIDSVYEGSKYTDTGVSEVIFYSAE